MKSRGVLKIAGLIAVFLPGLFFNCFAQQHGDSVSAAVVTTANSDSTVLTFMHIKLQSDKIYTPKSFKLSYKTDQINWTSDKLTPITTDSLGYLVKVRIPIKIYNLNQMFTCEAIVGSVKWKPTRQDTVSYGGVTAHGIQLELKSTPNKAEVFLIPRRLWLNQIKSSKWQQDNSLIESFMVDSDKTDTSVSIDETVYMVIFKLGNKYLVRTHYTKAKEIEPIQKVSVDF